MSSLESYSESPSTGKLVLRTMAIVPHSETCWHRWARSPFHRLALWTPCKGLPSKICPPSVLTAGHAHSCGRALTKPTFDTLIIPAALPWLHKIPQVY